MTAFRQALPKYQAASTQVSLILFEYAYTMGSAKKQ